MRRARALVLLAAPAFAGAAPALAPLRIGASNSDSYLEPCYAQELGAFARAGIGAEITFFPNAGAIVAAVIGGAIDIGMADMIQIANLVGHGFGAGFFAGASMYSSDAPTTLLCASKSSSYATARDLEGQSLAVPALTSLTSLAAKEWLAANGADVTKVSIFELPFAQMAPALTRGTIAAAMIGEPFITYARNEVRAIAKPFDVIGRSFYIGAWFAPRAWASQNAALVRRFTGAVYETARYANAHQDRTLAWLGKYAKIEVDRVRTMRRITWASSLDPLLMQPVLDLAVKYREIERPVRAEDLVIRI